MIVGVPLILLGSVIGKEASFLLYYGVSMGGALATMLKIRSNKGQHRVFHFEMEDPYTVVFIVVATIALIFGMTTPLVSLIPIPEFFKAVFIELNKERGLFSFVTIVIAAPVLEELIFRGIILDGFLRRYSPLKAILFSSFLFGLIHFNPWQFVGAGVAGIFMGWVYYRTRNVGLTIIIHLANNLCAFVMGHMRELTMDNIDDSLIQFYGGILPFVFVQIFSMITLMASIYYLSQRMRPVEASLSEPVENELVTPGAETPEQVKGFNE
jgi:uncharacterized protein